MDQRGALQCLDSCFLFEVVAGQPSEILIDQRHKIVQSTLVTLAPALQEFCYLIVGSRHHLTGEKCYIACRLRGSPRLISKVCCLSSRFLWENQFSAIN